mgnify:CR=1 FL=1
MSVVNLGIPLSGSSNSLPIIISSVSSPGTLIHTTDTDEHFINTWVNNISTSPVTVTVIKGLGSNYNVASIIKVPPQSVLIPLEPGILLTDLQEYRVYASVTNVIIISGHVLKRTGQ